MPIDKDTGVTVSAVDVVNHILPFCAQGVDGRDLLAQADYAVDVQRAIGHQPGIARQELANKQARQTSHMAAGLAQFLARRHAPGVKDDGDLDKVEAALVAVVLHLARGLLPGLATPAANGLCRPDDVTIKISVDGKLSVVKSDRYDLGEFYYFRHPALRPGFQPAQGGLIANAATLYPDIWAYLQTTAGQLLCKTEAEWQALTQATWATLADGSKVGWNGIGGAPFYVQNLAAGTLRMPDLRGMYAEAAGFDSLGVGGVHGDATRTLLGWIATGGTYIFQGNTAGGPFHVISPAANQMPPTSASAYSLSAGLGFDSSRQVPVAAKNQPRAWGALACCYLGAPR